MKPLCVGLLIALNHVVSIGIPSLVFMQKIYQPNLSIRSPPNSDHLLTTTTFLCPEGGNCAHV